MSMSSTIYGYRAGLANVSVQVAQGSTSMTAYPLFAWAGRVDAIMPSTMPLGSVTIMLAYNGRASLLIPATVVAGNFGAYSTNGTSGGRGVILLQSSTSDPGAQNTTQVTAKPGQTVTLMGTGLGPINGPDNTAPPAGDLAVPLQVLVGGKTATPLHAGRAPNQPGKDFIQFVVPADAPAGCNTPVQVVTGGNIYSNVVTLSIDPNILQNGANSIAAFIVLRFGTGGSLGLAGLLGAGFVLFCFTLLVNLAASFIVNRSRTGASA